MSQEKDLPHNCHKVSVGERLPPEQVRNDGGEEEAGGEEAEHVVAVLEHQHRVRLKVRHVDCLPCLHHGRVLPTEKNECQR